MNEQHLKISAPGWETFTGDFGGVKFANGVSVQPLARRQIDRISSLVKCDLSDATGTPVVQAGLTARLVGMTNVPAEIGNGNSPGLRKANQEDIDADNRQRAAEVGRQPTQYYTKQELQAIASKEGIAGIRKIGDAWSVRDRSITKLIDLICNAQGAFKARSKQKADGALAQRKQAEADAVAKYQAREAEIEAKARLVVQGGTSNAIGPNGQNVTINTQSVSIITPPAEPTAPVAPIVTETPAGA